MIRDDLPSAISTGNAERDVSVSKYIIHKSFKYNRVGVEIKRNFGRYCLTIT